MRSYTKNTVESGLYCLLGRDRRICSRSSSESGSETAGRMHRCRFCSKLCGVPGPACQQTHTPCWVAQLACLKSTGRCFTTTIGRASHSPQQRQQHIAWPRDSCCCCLYVTHSKTSHSSRASCSFSAKTTPNDYLLVIRRLHAKSHPDPLNAVTGHREYINGTNWKYILDYLALVDSIFCSVYFMLWTGIPSCSSDDQEFAIRHKLNFVHIFDVEKRHILNSDQVCNRIFYKVIG